MRKYNWGILSTANIGRKAMIPALKASRFARVVAVASRDSQRAQTFAKELNIPKSFGDYQALLDDPTVEVIYNPLPNHLHKPWTIKAAEAGKHILCEKPLALNVEECHEMIAAAKSNGVQLMESFMYRHHPRIQAAREMVHKGLIGEIKTIESAFTFNLKRQNDIRLKPEMGGGALMDVGCYCINISRLMAGREPLVVQARSVVSDSGVDMQMTAILDFGEGLLAHFDCAFNQTHRQRCLIAGTKSFLVLERSFLPGKRKTVIQNLYGGNPQVYKFSGADEYKLIVEDFTTGIENGKVPYPAEDAVANMHVIQSLIESAGKNGKPVDL